MTSNYDILSKYVNNFEISKDISFEIIQEDFLKIKPVKIPIQDILTMKIIGEYISKLCNYLKWSYYDSIDNDIINLCKTTWSNINIDYVEIIRIIYNAKLEHKYIGKVKYEIIDYIDKIYQEQFSIKDCFLDNDIKSCHNYLTFRQEINKNIMELFEKYDLECNENDSKYENLLDEISNSFDELESDEDFNDATMIFDNIENIINEKVNILIKDCVDEFKSNNKDEKNPFILNDLKNKAMEDFVLKMDVIYKDVCTNKLNNFDEYIISNIIKLFMVNKQMSKSMFLLDLGLYMCSEKYLN
jgi:hypothetical protein